MATETNPNDNREREVGAPSGWLALFFTIILFFGGVALFIKGVVAGPPVSAVAGGLAEFAAVFLCCGFFSLQPNEARLLILFGSYHGTVRTSGFFWANPFYARTRGRIPMGTKTQAGEGGQTQTVTAYRSLGAKISLRVRNFNSEKLKVNDKRGNPVEIAAVVVWRVADTARAAFDVDDFESYVHIQSETAVRHMASLYSYDQTEENEPTLRGSADEVARVLKGELQERLEKAGVIVDETRLTHLAYAPEIAQTMLRRQQAEAVIAARQKIVHGAVSMVEMALRELSEKEVVHLDEERKAAMVSNLLVVLCGESEVKPVVNTGTLYT